MEKWRERVCVCVCVCACACACVLSFCLSSVAPPALHHHSRRSQSDHGAQPSFSVHLPAGVPRAVAVGHKPPKSKTLENWRSEVSKGFFEANKDFTLLFQRETKRTTRRHYLQVQQLLLQFLDAVGIAAIHLSSPKIQKLHSNF